MKIPISKIEEVTGLKIKQNFTSIGFDWATRAGIAFIKTTDKYATIEVIFIEFKTAEVKDKYRTMVKTLENLISSEDLAVIENVFVGFNNASSMELAKYHAFAISECIRKNVPYETISAVSCRAKLKIDARKFGKGKSKEAVAYWLKENLAIDLSDDDASDAICLALCGILKDFDFLPKPKPKKKRVKKGLKKISKEKK